eukprot:748817-Rhodomonas_salina.1
MPKRSPSDLVTRNIPDLQAVEHPMTTATSSLVQTTPRCNPVPSLESTGRASPPPQAQAQGHLSS